MLVGEKEHRSVPIGTNLFGGDLQEMSFQEGSRDEQLFICGANGARARLERTVHRM
jgi:hypothetical protein